MKLAIKEKLINFKEMIKKLFEKYPLTLILIYIVTFFFAILMDTSVMRKEWVQKLFMFGTIWGIGTFFAEITKIDDLHQINNFFTLKSKKIFQNVCVFRFLI